VFLAAILPSSTNLIQPCPNASQLFVVDSNGLGVEDTTPPGAWSAQDSSPVSHCGAITWLFAAPSSLVPDTYYNFVVAGGTTTLDCSTTPDSQFGVTIFSCSISPTATYPMTPTSTPTITPTLSPTPTPTPLPTFTTFGPTPSATVEMTPTPDITDTFTPTPTANAGITQTPVFTDTYTPTPTTSGPITIIYANSPGACSAAFGCSISFVNACRALYLDFETSYIIMRLGATCGCQPSDIMQLRLTMSWDEICAHYGLDWATFVADLQTRVATLAPEIDTPTMIMRADANDPSQFPMTQPVAMPDHLTYVQAVTEVVPVCP
jgi:hypothetical protein